MDPHSDTATLRFQDAPVPTDCAPDDRMHRSVAQVVRWQYAWLGFTFSRHRENQATEIFVIQVGRSHELQRLLVPAGRHSWCSGEGFAAEMPEAPRRLSMQTFTAPATAARARALLAHAAALREGVAHFPGICSFDTVLSEHAEDEQGVLHSEHWS